MVGWRRKPIKIRNASIRNKETVCEIKNEIRSFIKLSKGSNGMRFMISQSLMIREHSKISYDPWENWSEDKKLYFGYCL